MLIRTLFLKNQRLRRRESYADGIFGRDRVLAGNAESRKWLILLELVSGIEPLTHALRVVKWPFG
jgi:hypothetical protein